MLQGVYDFHTHTFFSDGVLSPLELIRRAAVKGYKAIALTDHVGPAVLEELVPKIVNDCLLAQAYWGIIAIPGVELTHLPPATIPGAAEKAKKLGARLVVVHGESPIEPVEKGTNLAAVTCPYVDLLAHPGFLSPEEARLAADNGIFIELSARKGHCLTNGYLARLIEKTEGLLWLVCSDAHEEEDLLSPEAVSLVLKGAGMEEGELTCLETNICLFLSRLSPSLNPPSPRCGKP